MICYAVLCYANMLLCSVLCSYSFDPSRPPTHRITAWGYTFHLIAINANIIAFCVVSNDALRTVQRTTSRSSTSTSSGTPSIHPSTNSTYHTIPYYTTLYYTILYQIFTRWERTLGFLTRAENSLSVRIERLTSVIITLNIAVSIPGVVIICKSS
jgi:hypothetical protein